MINRIFLLTYIVPIITDNTVESSISFTINNTVLTIFLESGELINDLNDPFVTGIGIYKFDDLNREFINLSLDEPIYKTNTGIFGLLYNYFVKVKREEKINNFLTT